jgi:hypothetical protein
MRFLTLFSFVIVSCGCSSLEPVKGANEVHTVVSDSALVTTMPDGSRFVVLSRGEEAFATILLPPVKGKVSVEK